MDDQALAIFSEMADDGGSSFALNEKASQLTMLGDLPKAKEAGQRSLDLARKTGNKELIVPSLFYLGNIAKLEGRLEDAHKTFTEVLSVAQAVGDVTRSTVVEFGLAEVAQEEGHLGEARQHIQESLTYLHQHKDPDNEIIAEILLARVALAEGKTPEAVQAMDLARALFGQRRDWEGSVILGITNSRVQAATGKLIDARQSLKTVIAETTKRSNVRYQLEARLALCELEAKTDPASAHTHAKALEKEARSKGFGLIARKALAMET